MPVTAIAGVRGAPSLLRLVLERLGGLDGMLDCVHHVFCLLQWFGHARLLPGMTMGYARVIKCGYGDRNEAKGAALHGE